MNILKEQLLTASLNQIKENMKVNKYGILNLFLLLHNFLPVVFGANLNNSNSKTSAISYYLSIGDFSIEEYYLAVPMQIYYSLR